MKPELLTYLQMKAKTTFDIETNNCIQFTNDCWSIYHGKPYSVEYAQMRCLEDSGFASAVDAFDAILERSERPQEGHLGGLFIPGDTYLHGFVTGFCVGDLTVFLNSKGVKYISTKLIKYSWKEKDAV